MRHALLLFLAAYFLWIRLSGLLSGSGRGSKYNLAHLASGGGSIGVETTVTIARNNPVIIGTPNIIIVGAAYRHIGEYRNWRATNTVTKERKNNDLTCLCACDVVIWAKGVISIA